MKTRNLLMFLLLMAVAHFGVAQSAGNTQLSREERSKITPSISLPAPAVSANQTVAQPAPAANLSREEKSKIVPHIELPAPVAGSGNANAPVANQQETREERSKVVPHISLPAPNN